MTPITSSARKLPLTAAIIGTTASAALAGSSYVTAGENLAAPPIEPASDESFADKLWSLPVLYDNKDNPVIQKFQIIGRYQGQWHNTYANTGEDSGWENRRFRIGAKAKLFNDFTFSAELNLDNSNDFSGERFIEDVDALTLKYAPSDQFFLSLGKQKPKFTQEYDTSSKKIVTFERSLLVNQTIADKLWGVNVGGDYGLFDFQAGVFFGANDGDFDFPETDAGFGYALSLGFDISDNSKLSVDYVYNDGDSGNEGFADYQHLVSVNTTSSFGKFGLATDLIAGSGLGETDDVFGIVILPTYDITDKLQVVGRYQYATSSGDAGIRLQSRYERPAVEDGSSDRGDNYHAFYLGGNYRIYGDKLKLLAGAEYSTLGGDADFNGFTFLTGVRLYF